ncbi:hypothetical protein [Paraliomyxa miuraensis]|uniref:hypothetical protein n=1 Tax=Paraliomyxa miuraensis TaxID=376150 RepID=UPI002254B7E2|nr:hypothetical protein [Paraliomyxa miuraensis]
MAGVAMALCLGVLGLSTALTPTGEPMLEHSGRTSGQLAMHEAVTGPESRTTTAPRVSEAMHARPAEVPYEDAPELAEDDPEPAGPVAEPVAEPEPKPTKKATRTRSTASSRSTKAKVATKNETKNEAKAKASIPVECVLDPSRCDDRGSITKTTAAEPSSRPAPLPAKLSTSQLKQAFATTKADARRCGPEHGVDPGVTVRVKLSIEGSTGSVLSATPQDEHATGSLGRCVARALAQTEFPRFSSTRMGTIYSVRL